MGFVVDYDSFDKMAKNVDSNYDSWSRQVVAVSRNINSIINYAAFKGEGADSYKKYLTTIHKSIIGRILQILYLHREFFVSYKRFYNQYIDSDVHVYIDEMELQNLINEIKDDIPEVDQINTDIINDLKKIYGLVWAKIRGYENVLYSQRELIKFNNEIIENINLIEENAVSSFFSTTTEAIKSLNNLINECNQKNREFKTNFEKTSISDFKSWNSFVKSGDTLKENIIKYSSFFEETDEFTKQRNKYVADYKKREERQRYIKIGVSILTNGFSFIVIVSSGGTASPLVYGLTGAINSMANTATDKLTDLYVEKGSLRNLSLEDWADCCSEVGFAGITGGIVGYAKSYISIGNDDLFGSVLTEVVKENFKGVEKRTGKTYANAYNSYLKTGEADWSLAEKIFEYNEVRTDSFNGILNGTINQIFDAKTDTSDMYKYNSDSSGKLNEFLKNAQKENLKEIPSGMISRFTDKVFDGYSLNDAFDEAFKKEEVLDDFFGATKKGGENTFKNEPST